MISYLVANGRVVHANQEPDLPAVQLIGIRSYLALTSFAVHTYGPRLVMNAQRGCVYAGRPADWNLSAYCCFLMNDNLCQGNNGSKSWLWHKCCSQCIDHQKLIHTVPHCTFCFRNLYIVTRIFLFWKSCVLIGPQKPVCIKSHLAFHTGNLKVERCKNIIKKLKKKDFVVQCTIEFIWHLETEIHE